MRVHYYTRRKLVIADGNLIKKQGTGEQIPLFQLAIHTMLTSATT